MSRLLLVADAVSKEYSVEKILSDAGFEVVVANDSSETLEKLYEHKPALIIAERRVLHSDGYKLLDEIRQNNYSTHIPIIVISAECRDISSIFSARNIGIYDCISTPVKSDELLFKVAGLLDNKEDRRGINYSDDTLYESGAKWEYPAELSSGESIVNSEGWFRILFNQASDGILLLKPVRNSSSVIVDANDIACSIHGYARDELIGKPISFLDAPNSSIRPPRRINEIMKGGVTTFEVMHVRKDGSTFPVEVNARMIALKGKPYIQAIDRDITERKRAENELLRMQRRLNAQWEIARLVDTDRKLICKRVLDEIVGMTKSEYGFYGFLNKDESIVTVYSWSDEVMKDCLIRDKPIEYAISKSGLWGNAIRNRETQIVNDYAKEYPNKHGIPEGHITIRRLMVIPIFKNSNIVALGAVANKIDPYDKKDEEHVEAFLQSAQVIQDKKVVEEELKGHRLHLMELVEERTIELQETNEKLATEILERRQAEKFSNAVNALLKLFPQKASLKDYLDSVIALIKDWSRCECMGIRILNDHGYAPYEAYTGFSHDFWKGANWLSIEKDHCICMRIFTGKMLKQDASAMTRAGSFCCDNTVEFYNALSDEEKKEFGVKCVQEGYPSVAIIPINFRSRIVGVIHLADERKGMVFPNEVELIETITPFIGEAVHKFRVEDELRKNCEMQRESSELLEQMFTNIHLMIAYMDIQFNFIRVNRAFAKAFNKETDFFIGRYFFEIFPSEDNEAIFSKVVETGDAFYAYEKPIEYAPYSSKELTYWDWTLQPVTDLRGNVNSLVLSMLDVTQRKRAEAEALRSSQLASLGELAAGVAHEINNPINGIINYSQILANKSSPGSKEHDIAARIIKEGDRIAGIVKNLLSFARSRNEEKRSVHIYVIISEVLSLTGAQLRKDNIKINVDIPEDLPAVSVQPQQIEQVILNIISNSRYALNEKYHEMNEDKTIEITGEKTFVNDEPFIRLSLLDKGTGIQANDLNKIMNPFFSTKPSGEGTGLGLSISQNIVKELGGEISISSVEGEFTEVNIMLPVVPF